MPINFLKENLKKITLTISGLLFLFSSYLFAADEIGGVVSDEVYSLSSQARVYRIEGVKYQDLGDLDSALKMYQKAVQLDPAYPVAYNDLGIIYEAKGDISRAEESYLQALKIDPFLLDAYTNLALLYENKRELEKAVYYWEKRVELGNPDDPWTLKAQQRLLDVRLALSRDPAAEARQREAVALVKEVSDSKKAAAGKVKTNKDTSNQGDEEKYSLDIAEAQEFLNKDTTQNSNYNF
jgi:tetratricopeptide (TPR) repeat protein